MKDHIDRLENSIQLLNEVVSFKKKEIIDAIKKLISANQLTSGAVKILYYADVGILIVHQMKEHKPTAQEYINGVNTLFFHEARVNPKAKVWNQNFRKRTSNETSRSSVFEVVLVNPDGFITEGSRSNIFFIKNDVVYTTPENLVLSGITRKKVLSICKTLGIDVKFEMIDYRDISKFDSAFFTGTTRIMVPIRQIEDVLLQVKNPIFQIIRDNFEKLVKEFIKNHK